MQLRSMFSSIFGKSSNSNNPDYQQQAPAYAPFKMLNSYDDYFAPANISTDITVTTCIDTIASNFAKVSLQHVIADGKYSIAQSSNLGRLLSNRPNEYNSTYDFLYKLCYQLYAYNNAFCYIKRDNMGQVIGLYPLDYNCVQLVEDSAKALYCQFTFFCKKITVPYSDIIHLRRHYDTSEIYGGNNADILKTTLDDLATAKQSLKSAIKNSGKLRGYLQAIGTLRDDDKMTILDNFVDKFVGNKSNGSGIGIIDSRVDYHQLTSDLKTADTSQMDFFRQEIYRYFGLSGKIIEGNYSEAEYTAFYESTIKPLVIACEQEFTAKIFTQNELQKGNKITFATNRLEYSSIKSKTKMAGILMQTGIFSVNEFRQLFGFAPLADGDERLVSLNYKTAKGGGEKIED